MLLECDIEALTERSNEALAEWGKKNRDNLLKCNADKKALRELNNKWKEIIDEANSNRK